MKKGIRIFLAFLAVLFFAQVCFANYSINQEIQNSITVYDEKQTVKDQIEHDKTQEKIDKVVKVILISFLILFGIILLGVIETIRRFNKEMEIGRGA